MKLKVKKYRKWKRIDRWLQTAIIAMSIIIVGTFVTAQTISVLTLGRLQIGNNITVLSPAQLLLPDGTVAAPSLVGANYLNTGIFFSASGGQNSINFSCDGTERYRFRQSYFDIYNDSIRVRLGTGSDVVLTRAAKTLSIITEADDQKFNVITNTTLLTIAAGGLTSTWANAIPANSIVIGVSSRVTVGIPALATNYDVGIGGALTRYTTNASGALNTTHPGTDDGMRSYTAATDVIVTTDANPATDVGRIRLTVHYISLTPPTS